MEVNFKFKIEINLESFAAVVIATRLWDHPEIKSQIKKRFQKDNLFDQHPDPKELDWRKIVKRVSQHVDLLQLPERVSKKVKGIIEPIGDKIFYWVIYVLAFFKVDYKYAEKVYWTPYGSIDESKIFQLYWSQMEDIKEFPVNRVFYYSIFFTQEEFVSKNKKIMLAHTMETLQMNFKTLSPYAIIVIWSCIYNAQGIDEGIEMYKELKKSKKIALQLCKDCIESGTHLSAKYFWNRLTDKEKKEICDYGIENYGFRFNNKACYQEEGCVQIMLHILNDLSAEKRNDYILKNFESVFRYVMNVWPYQKLMAQLVDAYIDHLNERQLDFLLKYTLSALPGDFQGRRFVNNEVNAHIFCQVLQKIPKEAKLSERLLKDNFLRNLLDNCDLSVLVIILNDRDFLDQKEKFLELALPKLRNIIKSNDLDLVSTFVENVLPSKKDQKNLKLELNVAQDLINSGNIDLADKVLSWIADTDEEKIRLKKKIDPLKFGIDSKNFKYEMLEEFLSWLCDEEQEKRKLKDAMKNIEFVGDKIIKIWNQSEEEGECQCFEFLKQLTENDAEALELKNNLVIDEKLMLTYCDTLPSLNSFERIDGLLSFFSATPEEVLKIKKDIVKNIDKWLYRYIGTQKNFKIAEIILNYVCNDETEKRAVLFKYINSNSGLQLIIKAFMNGRLGHTEEILFLLNDWVKFYGNVDVIKRNMSHVIPKCVNGFANMFALVTLGDVLQRVKEGLEISDYDLHGRSIKEYLNNDMYF